MRLMPLSEVIRFGNGKSIKPGGVGLYPVFGSNGPIGGCDEYKYENGIIIGRVGAYCGAIVYCPGKFWASDNTLVAFPAGPEFDIRFISYLLRDANLSRYAGGAAQPLVTQTVLKQIEVRVPPLPIQRRIASILSAYDDLIENHRKRIAILEEMARRLYREWFVHFRYPGHESVPLVDSPLGLIPQGWDIKNLGGFVEFKSGFAFKSADFTTKGKHRLITIKNVQDGVFDPESDSRLDELPGRMPPCCLLVDGDILLSLTGNVGRVCLVYDGPFLLNQRVSKLVPLEAVDWALVYCMFRDSVMRVKLERLSNGVAQQNLSPVLASQMEFALPSRQSRQSFAVVAEPMVRSIVHLYAIILNLRRTRDLLLPRLMSGTLSVEALATAEAAVP